MKKNSTLMLILGMVLTLSASALPNIVDLPHTFSTSSTYGDIDLDGDETPDFTVYFSYYSFSGELDYSCHIQSANSGNLILIEGEDPRNPVSGTPPLSGSFNWVNILPYGFSIESTPPLGSRWDDGAPIAWDNSIPLAPPTASFMDSPNGYIGVQYYIGTDLYYAWISVSVDDDEPSVTLGGTVSAPMPNTPILAGSGSGVVPVPLIASIIGFMAIGSGAWLRIRRKRKK